LDPESVGGGVEAFVVQGRWRASGAFASAGVAWDPSDLLRVSAAVTWTDKLGFSPTTTSTAEGGEYSIPLEWRVGATATLTPGLALSAGVVFADWSDVGQELGEGTTREGSWSYGGGIEWARASLFGRPFPLRIGLRQQDLPFHFDAIPARERTISGGFGLGLVETDGIPIARVDVGFERGSRDAGNLSESFLRTTVSLRLAGS
jgi:hypothetical protein